MAPISNLSASLTTLTSVSQASKELVITVRNHKGDLKTTYIIAPGTAGVTPGELISTVNQAVEVNITDKNGVTGTVYIYDPEVPGSTLIRISGSLYNTVDIPVNAGSSIDVVITSDFKVQVTPKGSAQPTVAALTSKFT